MRLEQALARANALKLNDNRFFIVPYERTAALVVRDPRFRSLFILEDIPESFVWFSGDVTKWNTFFKTTKPQKFWLERRENVPVQAWFDESSQLPVTPIYQGEQVWGEMPVESVQVDGQSFKALLGLAARCNQKDTLRPGLQNVKFDRGWFEAGDEAQMARLPIPGNFRVEGPFLYPARGFDKVKLLQRSVPKLSILGNVLFLESEEEVRRVPAVDGWYPPTDDVFAEQAHFQAEVAMPARALLTTLKAFTKKEQRRNLRVWIEGTFLNIDGPVESPPIELEHPPSHPLDVMVHGERLSVLAKTWPAPEVVLRWAPSMAERTPLRFETRSGYTEHVYPLLKAGHGTNQQVLDGHGHHRRGEGQAAA